MTKNIKIKEKNKTIKKLETRMAVYIYIYISYIVI